MAGYNIGKKGNERSEIGRKDTNRENGKENMRGEKQNRVLVEGDKGMGGLAGYGREARSEAEVGTCDRV